MLCFTFYIAIYACTNDTLGLMAYCWPFSSHNCRVFPSTHLVYRSAIYPQGITFEYGLGVGYPLHCFYLAILPRQRAVYYLKGLWLRNTLGITNVPYQKGIRCEEQKKGNPETCIVFSDGTLIQCWGRGSFKFHERRKDRNKGKGITV